MMAFPDTDLTVSILAYMDADPTADSSTWPTPVDLSSRLTDTPMRNRAGRQAGQKTASSGQCVFELTNTDGYLTPLNPASPYYDAWDVGTPVAVDIEGHGWVRGYGLECVVYMGSEDVKRQSPNVYRMNLLGATVVPVESGSRTLKDALNEAMRDWVTNVANTFYIIGTVAGPHPYPMMVRDFQSVIGREARAQMLAEYGRLPDALVACVGGGSNAIGLFHAFLNDPAVRIVGAEAAGEGIATGHHAASLAAGRPGVLHGNRSYVLCDDDG